MTKIEETLSQREERYGSFANQAKLSQGIKQIMKTGRNWNTLKDDQREALEMVAHKIARILNGDANYHDSWHDIIGYTKLVVDELEEVQL